MTAKDQETLTETGLVCKLIESQRSFQTYAARLLYSNISLVASLFEVSNVAPDPAVREQFGRSVDAVEERVANIGRLGIRRQVLSDLDQRWSAISPKRQEVVRLRYQSILAGLGIKLDNGTLLMTNAQRGQLKALLKKGLEGRPGVEDSDKNLVTEILWDLFASR